MMKTFNKKFAYWLFEDYKFTGHILGFYRIIYALVIIFVTGTIEFEVIAHAPSFFYNPNVSFASFFSAFPPFWVLRAISLSVIMLMVCLLFGYKTRLVSILIAILQVAGLSFFYAFGKINHNVAYWLIPFFMAFSGWGNYLSIDAKNKNGKQQAVSFWPVALVALSIGFMMFSAGFLKFAGGWLDIDSQAVKGQLFRNYSLEEKSNLLTDLLISINSNTFWEFSDYLIVLFEIAFLPAAFSSKIYRYFIFFAILFHIAVYLSFNISFALNPLMYLLFINRSVFDGILKKESINQINRFMNIRNFLIFLILFILLVIIPDYLLADSVKKLGLLPCLRGLFDIPGSIIQSIWWVICFIITMYAAWAGFKKHDAFEADAMKN